MSNQIEIRTFPKNRACNIKVSIIEEHGRRYVDIRQWPVVASGTYATSKGVRFDADYFDHLREAVDAMTKHLGGGKTSGAARKLWRARSLLRLWPKK